MGANLYLTDAERERLEKVRIGIAGAGGLGSNCAQHLVRAGIRHLRICDFDVVSASNLNRQFFFRDQIGEKKVTALGANLRRIEPELDLDLCDTHLTRANAATLFAGCDLVVEALDTVSAKTDFLSALLPTGMPLVAASGLAGWGRSNTLTVHRLGTNLAMVGDGTAGVSSAMPPQSPRTGIAAAMQANCAIALLLGKPL